MGEKAPLFSEVADLTDPAVILTQWRALAKRVIALVQVETKTRDAAIHSLSRRYRFGSWLLKLDRGDKVSDRFHLYQRLLRALEAAVDEQKKRLAADEAVLAAIRGANAAEHETATGIEPVRARRRTDHPRGAEVDRAA